MRVALAAAKRKEPGTFHKARRTTWVHMDRARPPGHPAAWFQFFDERELSALDAIGLMHLGKNAEAAELLSGLTGNRSLADGLVCR
ncbi:MAG: hypothetical protein ACRDP6_32915 [Actinoallomurus sp.]